MPNHYAKTKVRASLLHFFFGKALSAVVSLLTLIFLARWMAPSDYGVYIAFVALQASLLAMSSFGVETTTERFIPELRMHHDDSELFGFVLSAIVMRFASLVLLAILMWLLAKPITSLVGLAGYSYAFQGWVVVVLLTGLFVFSVIMLEAMLHQKHAQICMSLYVVIKLVLIVLAYEFAQLDIRSIVVIEAFSAGGGAALGLLLLLRRFSNLDLRSGWKIILENKKRMQRFAFFNYVAQVVFQIFSVEMMKLLVTRMLGVVHSALYGFAYSLAETVQRYLPAVLLLRLIKPIFVSRYTKSGDFSQMNEMARIILKLNLLMLAPIIAFSAVFGGELLSLLSDGKYADAHWIFVGILALLILTSHQLVLSILAGTLEKNAMQLYAGLASTIAFPCALFFIPAIGPIGAVAASAVSGVVYNIFATYYLRRAGFDYQPDLRGALVFLIAGGVLFLLSQLLHALLIGVSGLVVIILFGSAAYLVIVRLLSAFTQGERDLINSILPKRVFIF